MEQPKPRHSILQRLFRFALRIPILEHAFWWYSPYHLRLFKHLLSHERFVTTFENGIKIWIRHNIFVEAQIYWQGIQCGDRGEIALIKKSLKPDHVFFDIGANVGTFALVAAKLLPQGSVHAFEPSSTTHEHLMDNIALNGFNNIYANRLAVSNASAVRTLVQPDNWNPGISSLYISEGVRSEDVQTITLDEYVKSRAIDRIDIIKMDAEGSEMDVLDGGRETIMRYRPVMMMEVNELTFRRAGRTYESLLSLIRSLGYTSHVIHYDGSYHRINTASELTEHQNIVCLPE